MADTIYWTAPYDYTTAPGSPNSGSIRSAPLAGGGAVDTLYDAAQGVNIPSGLAIDPAAGRIYWANYSDDTIRRAPLAGGGTPDTLYGPADGVSDPSGVAIDPVAGRIYWTNGEWASGVGGTIRRAPLAGGGTVDPLYGPAQGVSGPTGVAIDPVAGRIYWANAGGATIQGAPLAGGSNPTTLYGPAQGVSGPCGVAIDAAAGRIYWTNVMDGTIRGAALAGSGTVDIVYDQAQVWYPGMLAVDPTPAAQAPERLGVLDTGRTDRFAVGRWLGDLFSRLFPTSGSPPNRIYWANRDGAPANRSALANKIRGGPLGGGGTPDTLYGTAEGPMGVAVVRAPVGTGPPMVSWSLILDQGFEGWQFGGGHSGSLDQRISCSRGTWAPDLPGSFLYRAPQPQGFTYQWRRDGTDIGGATSANYTPSAPGSYSCRVTATNVAGSASQTSAGFTVS